MVDKERLKEIKKHRDEAENSIDEYEFEKINFYNLHVDWLIEQAERVEEYRSSLEHGAMVAVKTAEKLHHQQQENKRYREAIEVAIHNMATSDNLGVKFALGILEQALEGEE